MAKTFDLKKQLKLHDLELLYRLCVEEHEVLTEVPWDDIRARERTSILESWEFMYDDTRRQLEVILQDVNELSDERSQKVLIEDLQLKCPEKLAQFAAWQSLHDKALWAFLEARSVFDEAAVFAHAEALRSGQFANRWNSLPKSPIQVTPQLTSNLEGAVRAFYRQKELRGDQCRVHHYARANGADFFYAYLPEWADKRLGFDTDGNLTPRELHYAFSNVFIYEAAAGALEIIARGGKKVQLPLRRAFCRSVLGLEVDDSEPMRRTYHLDHLLDPTFTFTTLPEDHVANVRLRRLRLLPNVPIPVLEGNELKLREDATLPEVRHAVAKFCGSFGLTTSQVSIVEAGIQLEFQSDGVRKARTLTFNVSLPNTCDLKSKPDSVREVGERCIRRWEVLCA